MLIRCLAQQTNSWGAGQFRKKLKEKEDYKEGKKRDALLYIIMLLKSVETQYSKEFDYNQFKDLVVNGSLYEHLMETFGDKFAVFKHRQKVKTAFLEFMYHNSNAKWKGKAEINAIKKMFPSITALFSSIKQYDYTALSILLQSLERYLIIDVICKKIHDFNPKITLYTIHDSIATTSEFVPLLEAVMRQELMKATGHSPSLEIETWHINEWEKHPEKHNIKTNDFLHEFLHAV